MALDDLMDEEDRADLRDSRGLSANQAYGGVGMGQRGNDDEEQLYMSSLGQRTGQGVQAFVPAASGSTESSQPKQQQGVWDPLLGSYVDGLGPTTNEASGSDPMATVLGFPTSQAASQPTRTEPTKGTHILLRMGWRQGTGLGPRISYAASQRLRHLNSRLEAWTRGAASTPIGEEEKEDPMYASKHTYAPPDTHILPLPTRKDATYHGIGFGSRRAARPSEQMQQPPPLPRGDWVWGLDNSAPSVAELPAESAVQPPRDWAPDPTRILSLITNRPTDSAPTNRPTATTRAQLLGERPAPGPAPKLSDYLPSHPLKQPPPPQGPPPGPSPPLALPQPIALPDTNAARSALSGFIPFGVPSDDNDPNSKRARYVKFLRLACEPAPGQGNTVETWATEHKLDLDTTKAELKEFLAASRIFRPLAGALAGRFASSSTPTSTSAISLDTTSGTPSASTSKDTEPNHAIRLPTRTIVRWYPDRLLAKRMGCSHPPAGLENATQPGVVTVDAQMARTLPEAYAAANAPASARTWIRNQRGVQDLVATRAWEEHGTTVASTRETLRDDPISEVRDNRARYSLRPDQVGLADDVPQVRDQPTRPPMDLLRSVFGESEEEEEEEESQLSQLPALSTSTPASVTHARADGSAPSISFVARNDRRTKPGKGGFNVSSFGQLGDADEEQVKDAPQPKENKETKPEKKKKKKTKGPMKQRGLLSFGDAEEEEPPMIAKPKKSSTLPRPTPPPPPPLLPPPPQTEPFVPPSNSSTADAARVPARPRAADLFD